MPTSVPGGVKESPLPLSGRVQRSPLMLTDVFSIEKGRDAQGALSGGAQRGMGLASLVPPTTPEVTRLWLVRTLMLSVA